MGAGEGGADENDEVVAEEVLATSESEDEDEPISKERKKKDGRKK